MVELKPETTSSIDKKMDKAKKNKYFVYKEFQSSSGTTSEEKINYTLNKAEWIYEVYDELLNFEFNPYETPYNDRIRILEDYPNHDNECEEYGSKIIDVEPMIQRNIYLNNNLYPQLEKIIDYEINIPYEDKKASIDLLAYKKDNGKITFIIEELKACKLVGEDFKKEDAKDLLLRAMMEALLYGCYFKKALEDNGEDLVKYLMKKIEDVSIAQIKNAKIEYYIIAPESIINQKNQEWFKKFDTNKFSFFTISQATEIVGKVGDKIKYFNIEKKA